ncbi:MAG: 50S ribosomal protein L3 N(5)-glutamine methyltransferase [Sulfurifustaceae bacterium]
MHSKSIDSCRTVRDAIIWADRALQNAGVYCGHGTTDTVDEAAWLVGGALKWTPAELDARLDDILVDSKRGEIEALIEQRIRTRKPAAYLLNQAWFAGLPFYVDERVLVPRSLTAEVIEEQFAPWIDAARVRRILDIGTGSGCMAIAAALAFPAAEVDAADISADALAVARINVERHDVAGRVHLLQSDLYAGVAGRRYDVILTNPPYVAPAELDDLPPEYGYEPRLALVSGTDGLDAILRILVEAPEHLEPHAILVAEVGNSCETLQRALPDVPFVWLETAAGDDSVFLLTAAQVAEHTPSFARAVAERSGRAMK